MLDKFISFIEQENQFRPEQPVLLAVSSGIDSVVMAHLFRRARFRFGIAHCNFRLRGRASDLDELFAENLAIKYEVPFYNIHFNTQSHAKNHGLSIQMAARELRYNWLEKIIQEKGYDVYATAHHLDDQIETFFINFLRGTGISGLRGIPSISGNCVRPILFASRNDIISYQKRFGLSYREDQSNLSERYQRNKIRLRLLPVLEEIQQDYREAFFRNFENLKEVERIFKRDVQLKCDRLTIIEADGSIRFPIDALINLHPIRTYLHELLLPYHFTNSDIQDIIACLDNESGRQFLSSTHRLLKDRDYLILTRLESNTAEQEIEILESYDFISGPVNMKFEKINKADDHQIEPDKDVAELDLDQLTFPLKIRKWKKGDSFRPLGMNQNKKLSDFFVDEKLSLYEKENTWVVLSDDEICWIIGHRIAHSFRITDNTRLVYRMQFINPSK